MAAGENLSSKLLSMKFMKNSSSDTKEDHKLSLQSNEPHKWRLSTTLPKSSNIPPKRVINLQGQNKVVVLVNETDPQDQDAMGKMSFGKFQSTKPSKREQDENDISSSSEDGNENDDDDDRDKRRARKAVADNDRRFLKAAQRMTSISGGGGGNNNNNNDKKRRKDQQGKNKQFKKKKQKH